MTTSEIVRSGGTPAEQIPVERAPVRSEGDPGPRGRFYLLDSLRMAAALAVVLYHFTSRENAAWGLPVAEVFPSTSKITAFGGLGVQLFFIISGFVILLSVWGRSPSHFIASRIGRLFPAYWTGVLLTGFLLLVVWPEGKDISMTQVLVNLTMLQEPLGVAHVDGVYWTLWEELKFYVLIGVLATVGITRSRILLFCTFWPIAAVMAGQAQSPFLSELLMPHSAALFAGGMMIYLLHREGPSMPAFLVLGMNVILAAQQTTTSHFRAIEKMSGHDFADYYCWLAIMCCFLIVAATTLTPLKQVSWKWLALAGSLTYPLYLIHEYWGWWFISVFESWLSPWLTLLVATVLCVVLAWVIHRAVERPLGPKLRRSVGTGLERLKAVDDSSRS
ncbi:putative acyltransferase [Arthrobacter crystallopoietes BAB-32]|uniref:Putative acyltransferase n=1 Tax=Arthrobacter crystallopoietes BAB-32 TaxID=1246476 RepID=N1UVD8_9MICC|nr:acyltransferase [Arthrobacter crystallopoietes]EMY34356.1 putative acyltransferase [Arthrobacter crystallopoietes BAB-32]